MGVTNIGPVMIHCNITGYSSSSLKAIAIWILKSLHEVNNLKMVSFRYWIRYLLNYYWLWDGYVV